MPATLKSNMGASQIKAIFQAEAHSALKDIGVYVQSRAAKYPKQNPKSTYRRTGTLGRSIAVSPVSEVSGGYRVEVGTNIPYAEAVEKGTGIYGPQGQPITPKNAKALAWLATRGRMQRAGLSGGVLVASGVRKSKGKLRHDRNKDSMVIFAGSVKGFPGWHFMEKAFTGQQTKTYVQSRLKQFTVRVKAQLV